MLQSTTITTTTSAQYKVSAVTANGIVQLAHGLGLHYHGVLQSQYPTTSHSKAQVAKMLLAQSATCPPIAGLAPKVVKQSPTQGTIQCPYNTYTVYVNGGTVYAILPSRKQLSGYKQTVNQIYNG